MTIFTLNHCPAEPGYALLLQTVQIQVSWLFQKPTSGYALFGIQYVNLYQQSRSSDLIG